MAIRTITFRRKFSRLTQAVLGWAAGITGAGGCLVFVVAFLTAAPAWITHIVFCIKHHDVVFLLAGAVFFPIGIIHGWGLWFGWWV